MKKLITILILFFAGFNLAQNIPNAGFENWTGNNPDGWFALNLPGFFEPVTKSNDSHSGNSAARLEIVPFGDGVALPLLTSFFMINEKPGSLQGNYKFFPVTQGHFLVISALFWSGTDAIGAGVAEIITEASQYTSFAIPIEYFSDLNPDSVQISIAIGDTSETMTAGAYALIDDLSFGGTVSVDDDNTLISEFKLKQNYPNPFNPSTTIEYSVPAESFVELKIYDVLGNDVSTLTKGYHPAGNFKIQFDGSKLSSGNYIVVMKSENSIKSVKMILMK